MLGIDPGLTRCGVGVVDVARNRSATLVHVGVIRTPTRHAARAAAARDRRGHRAVLDEHRPTVVALERVFAQHNLRTVMGTAQASGVALLLAAARGLAVGLHTPTEVKAAITGYGAADKKQVGTMVAQSPRSRRDSEARGCRGRPRARTLPRVAAAGASRCFSAA